MDAPKTGVCLRCGGWGQFKETVMVPGKGFMNTLIDCPACKGGELFSVPTEGKIDTDKVRAFLEKERNGEWGGL